MSIDPEAVKAAEAVGKILTSDVAQGFGATLLDLAGIRPLAMVKNAKAEAERITLIAKAESEAALDRAETDQKMAIIKAKTDVEVDVIKLNGKAKLEDLGTKTIGRRKHVAQLEQRNCEAISGKALLALHDLSFDPSGEKLDPDWVYRFFDNCKGVSDAEMQTVWAKILANEFAKPGSFSPLTLETMKTITRKEAEMFTLLCSHVWTLSWTIFGDQFPVFKLSYLTTHRLSGSYAFKINHVHLHHLQSHGLVIGLGTNMPVTCYSSSGMTETPSGVVPSLKYFGRSYKFEADVAECEKSCSLSPGWGVWINYLPVNLSAAGRELMPISGAVLDEDVITTIEKFLEKCRWFHLMRSTEADNRPDIS